MKKIRMLRDVEGSPNGVMTRWYYEGVVYEIGGDFLNKSPESTAINESLAEAFLKAGYAEKAGGARRKKKAAAENKAATPTENK